MSSLIQTIADVMSDHRIVDPDEPSYNGPYTCEGCDHSTNDYTAWEEHQAAMVVAAIPAFGVQHENGHISLTSSRTDCEAFITERGGPLHLVERSPEWRRVIGA